MLYMVRVQQLDEPFDGVGRMTDGEEDAGRHNRYRTAESRSCSADSLPGLVEVGGVPPIAMGTCYHSQSSLAACPKLEG